MTTQDFTATILVDQSPEEAYKAIRNMRGWWSEEIEGSAESINDEQVYHYKDVHYCKMRLVELVSGKKVVWLVLDNFFKFTKDQAEWKGTKLVFDIALKGNQTEIRFTHEGLVPQYECYEVCNKAWSNYINNSLKAFIATGKGQPNSKEDDKYNAALVEEWKLAVQ